MSIPENETKISLRVYPNAARNEVVGITDGVLRVRVSKPPVKGKANRELIDFLSQLLGIGKSRLSIIKGHTSRSKFIAIDGLPREEIIKRLLPNQSTKPFSSGDDASK